VTLVKRKALALTLITIPVLSFLFCGLIVQPVDSQSFETIYIRADGSIEGTNKIQRDGDVYIFISDISGSIVVERDNIVLEGSGFILQGTTTNQSTGDWDFVNVNISSRKNVTVKNLTMKYAGYDAVRVSDSSNCSILDTTIIVTQGYYAPRIHLNNSSHNVLSGNNVQIYLVESNSNILFGNTWSLRFSKSSNNTIIGNGNSIELTESSNNFISENNSTIHLDTQSNGNIISENIGFIGLWGSSNNSIIGNNEKILIVESQNNTIIQNTAKNCIPYGIQLSYSTGNIFSENVIENSKLDIRIIVNNTFYRNDFLNVTVDIVDDSVIFWDNDGEGNYWSNYNGTDKNEDCIGDTPFIINEDNQDNYPLMNPVVIPELPDRTGDGTDELEPFPTLLAVAVTATVIVIFAVCLLLYFKKRKH
jgi:parallel beta-helix repeat protein